MLKRFILNQKKKIDKISNRQSNVAMNLMKTFGIIAVVCSHTKGGAVTYPMGNWIHPTFYFMPLFVFASGFLYREEADDENIFRFLYSKVKSLVIPYFVWNFVYGLLNAFFRNVGIISYGDDISLYSLFVRPWIDGHQFHFNIASWFMLSLFIDILCIFLIRKAFKKLRIFNDFLILGLTFAISIISIYAAEAGYNYGGYLCLAKAGFMLPYFQLGYLCKKKEAFLTKYRSYWVTGLLLVQGALIILCQPVSVQVVFARFSGSPWIISALTAAALMFVWLICEILAPAFQDNKICRGIGDHTFDIMMHHGFVVFLINLAIYGCSKFFEISSFSCEEFQRTLWYCCPWRTDKIFIIYLLLGVFVPVAIRYAYNQAVIRSCKKIGD